MEANEEQRKRIRPGRGDFARSLQLERKGRIFFHLISLDTYGLRVVEGVIDEDSKALEQTECTRLNVFWARVYMVSEMRHTVQCARARTSLCVLLLLKITELSN